ncbi:MAG: flavin reductase [Bacteroidota bacterium]
MGVKRPWNIVNMPVYSLATYRENQVNMNICTYVSAVSMKPKLFMVAIDYNTLTFKNLEKNNHSVLQILHKDHQPLVNLLGKKSGKSTDKQKKLEDKKALVNWNGNIVLDNACGYLQMIVKERADIGGDHELFYFEVEKSSTRSEEGVLMFQDLIKEGIIL